MKNQKGITLIEILITITLLSIIGLILWNVFIQGSRFSEEAMTKNRLNQEANIVLSNLDKFHQDNDVDGNSYTYNIEVEDCKIKVVSNNRETSFEHPNICYKIEKIGDLIVDDTNNINVSVSPKEDDYSLPIILTLEEKENPWNLVTISTNLYRLKEEER